MKFSASELVKRSASQYLYKELKKLQWKTTPGQLKGEAYAEEIVKKEDGASEKRGILQINDDLLFFCVDMVKDNLFIEIKMVTDQENYEDWYLYSSIMQSTFYATMLNKVQTLDTPKFRKKEGYPQEVIIIPDNKEYQLWFGTDKYKIFPNEKVFNFYKEKLLIISKGVLDKNYDSCRIFDSKYKFKEYSILKPKYEKIA